KGEPRSRSTPCQNRSRRPEISGFLFGDLFVLLASLRQADCDRLLAALNFATLAAAPALCLSFLIAAHLALDVAARTLRVPAFFLCLACHGGYPSKEGRTFRRAELFQAVHAVSSSFDFRPWLSRIRNQAPPPRIVRNDTRYANRRHSHVRKRPQRPFPRHAQRHLLRGKANLQSPSQNAESRQLRSASKCVREAPRRDRRAHRASRKGIRSSRQARSRQEMRGDRGHYRRGEGDHGRVPGRTGA